MHSTTLSFYVSASLLGLAQATSVQASAEDAPKWLHRRLADSILANAKAVTTDLNYMSCKIEQGAFAAASALGMGSASVAPPCGSDSSIVIPPKVVVAAVISASSASSQTASASSSDSTNGAVATAGSTTYTSSPMRALPSVNITSSNRTMAAPIRFTQLSDAQQSVILDPTNPCSSNDTEVCYEQYLALDAHNQARALHFAPPLVWNDNLAKAALTWATQCIWKHSHGSMFPANYITGENLYASTQILPLTTMATAVKGFMNEEAAYNYSAPGFSDTTGHFTQVVWNNTKQVGCAIINCDLDIFNVYTNASSFAVCVYFPSGNYAGEFAKNVFRPNTTQAPANI